MGNHAPAKIPIGTGKGLRRVLRLLLSHLAELAEYRPGGEEAVLAHLLVSRAALLQWARCTLRVRAGADSCAHVHQRLVPVIGFASRQHFRSESEHRFVAQLWFWIFQAQEDTVQDAVNIRIDCGHLFVISKTGNSPGCIAPDAFKL